MANIQKRLNVDISNDSFIKWMLSLARIRRYNLLKNIGHEMSKKQWSNDQILSAFRKLYKRPCVALKRLSTNEILHRKRREERKPCPKSKKKQVLEDDLICNSTKRVEKCTPVIVDVRSLQSNEEFVAFQSIDSTTNLVQIVPNDCVIEDNISIQGSIENDNNLITTNLKKNEADKETSYQPDKQNGRDSHKQPENCQVVKLNEDTKHESVTNISGSTKVIEEKIKQHLPNTVNDNMNSCSSIKNILHTFCKDDKKLKSTSKSLESQSSKKVKTKSTSKAKKTFAKSNFTHSQSKMKKISPEIVDTPDQTISTTSKSVRDILKENVESLSGDINNVSNGDEPSSNIHTATPSDPLISTQKDNSDGSYVEQANTTATQLIQNIDNRISDNVHSNPPISEPIVNSLNVIVNPNELQTNRESISSGKVPSVTDEERNQLVVDTLQTLNYPVSNTDTGSDKGHILPSQHLIGSLDESLLADTVNLYSSYFEKSVQASVPKEIVVPIKNYIASKGNEVKNITLSLIVREYLKLYIRYFEESDIIENATTKSAEILHLAIADDNRQEERRKLALRLTSNALKNEELNRADNDYKEMLSIRGNKFADVYKSVLQMFETPVVMVMTVTFFFKINQALLQIDSENINYFSKVRALMMRLLSNVDKSCYEFFSMLDSKVDSCYNFVKNCLTSFYLTKYVQTEPCPKNANGFKFALFYPTSTELQEMISELLTKHKCLSEDMFSHQRSDNNPATTHLPTTSTDQPELLPGSPNVDNSNEKQLVGNIEAMKNKFREELASQLQSAMNKEKHTASPNVQVQPNTYQQEIRLDNHQNLYNQQTSQLISNQSSNNSNLLYVPQRRLIAQNINPSSNNIVQGPNSSTIISTQEHDHQDSGQNSSVVLYHQRPSPPSYELSTLRYTAMNEQNLNSINQPLRVNRSTITQPNSRMAHIHHQNHRVSENRSTVPTIQSNFRHSINRSMTSVNQPNTSPIPAHQQNRVSQNSTSMHRSQLTIRNPVNRSMVPIQQQNGEQVQYTQQYRPNELSSVPVQQNQTQVQRNLLQISHQHQSQILRQNQVMPTWQQAPSFSQVPRHVHQIPNISQSTVQRQPFCLPQFQRVFNRRPPQMNTIVQSPGTTNISCISNQQQTASEQPLQLQPCDYQNNQGNQRNDFNILEQNWRTCGVEDCQEPAVMACINCMSIFYCSHNCQTNHWDNGHGQECSPGH